MRTSRSGNIATADDATDIGEGKGKLIEINAIRSDNNTGVFLPSSPNSIVGIT